MDKKIVVTLARQHYTGGLKIGKYLAEALGVNCYDSEMLRLVSDDKAMHDSFVAHDARIKDTPLFDVASATLAEHSEEEFDEADEVILMKNLFDYQSDIIRKLAERESCVIVGRCANHILAERDDVVSVFVHAPMEFRKRRASSVRDMSDRELEMHIRNTDERRADYYHRYTGGEWMDVSNYELSVDAGKYGIRGSADFIRRYLEVRFAEDSDR